MSAILQYIQGLSTSQKAVAAALIAGIVYKATAPSPAPRDSASSPSASGDKKSGGKSKSTYRDLINRLRSIMKIIFPQTFGREALHLFGLTVLLVGRTILSIRVAEHTGKVASHLVQGEWESFISSVISFGFLGIPAALVNSFLKYETTMLSLCFRDRLTRHINNIYVRDVNFYKAANLPQSHIENIDQRVTADIEKFCDDLSNLYTSLFKPILDIVLNTIRLSSVMGMRGPGILVVYYLLLGQIKMRLMPDFKKLTMQQSELEGDYRTAHSRLITNSEEISFFDGANRERAILTNMFDRLYKHCANFAEKKAWIGIIDQYLIKYGSSVTGYLIMSLPVFFTAASSVDTAKGAAASATAVGNNTRDFVRNRQLLMDLASAVGTLLQTVNKVASLAGSTSRVGEVLDSVNEITTVGSAPFKVRADAPAAAPKADSDEKESSSGAASPASGVASPTSSSSSSSAVVWGAFADKREQEAFLQHWRALGDQLRAQRLQAALSSSASSSASSVHVRNGGGTMCVGESIEFQDCAIVSPDGRLLVEHLNVQIPAGTNVMVTGPNGCGKSSLFRVLGELWPLHSGHLIKPTKEDIMFVPQKPYQVIGTLRDQLIYPHSIDQMKALGVTDEDLSKLLRVVDPANGILGQWSLDETRNWINAFSGGQKQRVAMARVFYHRPRYAILDECTSAVSEEVEGLIYTTCKKLGITIFTVSHRAQLQQYHDHQLRFNGFGGWEFLDNAELEKRKQAEIDASIAAAQAAAAAKK